MSRLLKVLVGLAALAAAAPAAADVEIVRGADRVDGSAMQGLKITAEGGGAWLMLICDEGDRNPGILISHRQVIAPESAAFRVAVAIDGGAEDRHWFLSRGSGRTGRSFIRYPVDYEPRFGEQPPSFRPGNASLNPDYLAWDRRIHRAILHEFVTGRQARIRIMDRSGDSHTYRFSLDRIARHAEILNQCYEPPDS